MDFKDFKAAVAEFLKYATMRLVPMEALLKLRERAQGTRQLTHKVRGRIAHPAGQGGGIAQLEVELWDRDPVGDDYLGVAVTDDEGRFEIYYEPRDAGLGDKPDFELRMFDPPAVSVIDGERRIRRQIVGVIKGGDAVRTKVFDFTTIELAYFEYEPNVGFPFSLRESIRRPFVTGAMKTFSDSLARFALIDDKFRMGLALGKT